MATDDRKLPHLTQRPMSWATPDIRDLMFFESVDMTLPQHAKFTYGQPHRDPTRYPDHELVYVSPQDDQKVSRWFYAARREDQDTYNWEIVNNNTLRRTYILKREHYLSDDYQTKEIPVVPTADETFTGYVFTGESVARVEPELDSLYVRVVRIYSIPTLVSYQWDDNLQRSIKITKEIIKAGTQTGSGSTGRIVEIQPGDLFYDLKITSEVLWGTDGNTLPGFPLLLDSVSADANYPFPPLLKSVKIFGAWAYAGGSGGPASYSEDFFYEVDIVEPHPGPFDATVLRFLTDQPEVVRNQYPTAQIVTRAETFGMVRFWAEDNSSGNSSYALAKQHNVQPTVHGQLTLPALINYVQGGGLTGVRHAPGSASLPATPDFDSYMASTTTVAGVRTIRSKLNLWEVQVTRINKGGGNVYGDDQAVFRDEIPGTGTGDTGFPGGGGNNTRITVWTYPKVNTTTNVNQADRTSPNGGNLVIQVTALEAWTWSCDFDWITITENLVQAATWPNAKAFAVSYAANATGAQRTGIIEFTDGMGYIHSHAIIQNPQ